MQNFLTKQYNRDKIFKLKHNYLLEQFSNNNEIISKIKRLNRNCDYTLGQPVIEFEKNFTSRVGAKFALGVGSGTDAIFLSLKAFGIGNGDEVITTPFTYIATIGAIATTGAKPVFVDIKEDCNMNEALIEKKITKKTKAIVPVHWSGRICEMKKIIKIAKKNKLRIIQDACHAVDAKYQKLDPSKLGDVACYSLHPLKNLNVWGDGGLVVTNNINLYKKISLLRNHGLISRDDCRIFGYNSRLDSIQAIVGNHFLKKKLSLVTKKRIQNSNYLDNKLKNIKDIKVQKRELYLKEVFHLYQIKVRKRESLLKYLNNCGIDAKIHYPKPIHLQKAAKYLKHKKGDFPNTEKIASEILSLPVHEFIKKKDLDYMISKIREFYN